MDTKWTPGPWSAQETEPRLWGRIVRPTTLATAPGCVEKAPVAVCTGVGLTDACRDANAALIAAAPDLYAALRDAAALLDVLTGNTDEIAAPVLAAARAALAKAEAQP